ncbi:MAG: AI-2E family transporter [Cytophagales bacterium]|nr:MAG: AI-2E family transporter [Cytophagales bacterium]
MTSAYPKYVKLFFVLAILIMLCHSLYIAQDILKPIAIALFFTFLLSPISRWLRKKRFSKWFAILLSIVLAIIVIIALFYFFVYQLYSFQEDLPELQKNLEGRIHDLQVYIAKNTSFSRREQTAWFNDKLVLIGQDASTYILNVFSSTGAFLADFFLIPIYVFFMTYYQERFILVIASISKAANQRKIKFIVAKVAMVSQQYIKGMLIDIIILALLNSFGFMILGLEHAILFGTLAAFLNIVPYIGVIVGSIFPILIALLTKDSIWYPIGVLGVCVFVQFLDNNFITPKVVGSSVSINPLAATLVLIIGAALWGVLGMILSIPVTGMIKVLLDNVNSLKPYGYLLGEEEKMK